MTDRPHKLPSNFNVLTFTTPCPSCGAPVEFVSAASAMAVCEYCQTTVVRQGEQISSQGKQSLTIEDYSPLQIGSVGMYQSNQFAVVGRIQMEYSDGIWNEWYIQFSHGHNGWLSEALGQYSLTLDKGEHPELPTYNQLSINHTVTFEDEHYTITDKRSAIAIAGEGELPFVMGKGWQTWVVDARYQRKLITLDYGEHGADGVPTIFKGVAVPLESLQMQMLKETGQVNQSSSVAGYGGLSLEGDDANTNANSHTNSNNNAGQSSRQKLDDEVGKIDCPNCGSPVPFVAGVTSCLMCPACHSEIKMTGANAEVVKIHSMMQSFKSTLPLGAKARINSKDIEVTEFESTEDNVRDAKDLDSLSLSNRTNSIKHHDYIVVGVQRLHEVDSYARWTEYLLYSFTDGFLWLSEEPKKGWMLSRVVNDLPTRRGKDLYYHDRMWNNYDGSYQSKVIFAIGAFNWQVRVNDYMDLTDYTHGQDVITAEQNESEITYTISTSVSDEQMQKWFGSQLVELTVSDEFGQYNPENSRFNSYNDDDWDDDDWDEKQGLTPKKILIFGLAGLYFFVFLGSIGAFIISLGIGIAGFVALDRFTDDEGSIFGYVIAIICMLLALGINSLFFGSPTSNRSSGSSVYYIPGSGSSSSSSGRTGYSSSGSHK